MATIYDGPPDEVNYAATAVNREYAMEHLADPVG
jgi:hypothetical protein